LLDTLIEKLRGEKDYLNHVSAAFISGLIFKSTAGLRAATIQGFILSSIVGGYGAWSAYEEGRLKMPIFSLGQTPIHAQKL
jgi:hypothetical protein